MAAYNNTKFIFNKAIASVSAESVKFIIQIISQWGCFQIFSSDRVTHFKNNHLEGVCNNLGTKQVLSTSYSLQSQGFVKKME